MPLYPEGTHTPSPRHCAACSSTRRVFWHPHCRLRSLRRAAMLSRAHRSPCPQPPARRGSRQQRTAHVLPTHHHMPTACVPGPPNPPAAPPAPRRALARALTQAARAAHTSPVCPPAPCPQRAARARARARAPVCARMPQGTHARPWPCSAGSSRGSLGGGRARALPPERSPRISMSLDHRGCAPAPLCHGPHCTLARPLPRLVGRPARALADVLRARLLPMPHVGLVDTRVRVRTRPRAAPHTCKASKHLWQRAGCWAGGGGGRGPRGRPALSSLTGGDTRQRVAPRTAAQCAAKLARARARPLLAGTSPFSIPSRAVRRQGAGGQRAEGGKGGQSRPSPRCGGARRACARRLWRRAALLLLPLLCCVQHGLHYTRKVRASKF